MSLGNVIGKFEERNKILAPASKLESNGKMMVGGGLKTLAFNNWMEVNGTRTTFFEGFLFFIFKIFYHCNYPRKYYIRHFQSFKGKTARYSKYSRYSR